MLRGERSRAIVPLGRDRGKLLMQFLRRAGRL
jgi:hypothetical protein